LTLNELLTSELGCKISWLGLEYSFNGFESLEGNYSKLTVDAWEDALFTFGGNTLIFEDECMFYLFRRLELLYVRMKRVLGWEKYMSLIEVEYKV
jgi:hypothetical protein